MRRPRGWFGAPLAAALCVLAAAPSEAAARRLRLLASVMPLREFAATVAGDRSDSSLLLPPGAGVHTWQPRPGDMARLAECDLLIHVGAGLEPWLPGLLAGLGTRRPATLEVAAGLDLIPTADHEEPEHGHGAFDPHVWLDPVLAVRIVDAIRDRLEAMDPEGADLFRRNAAALRSRLEGLDAAYRRRLSGCPGRVLVVAGHAAFGYLARRYGLEQMALYGASPDAQPKPSELIGVVRKARSLGVRAVFTESSVSTELARSLARELGLPTLPLDPGHNLTREQIRAGVGYFEIMDQNLGSLERGLGCR